MDICQRCGDKAEDHGGGFCSGYIELRYTVHGKCGVMSEEEHRLWFRARHLQRLRCAATAAMETLPSWLSSDQGREMATAAWMARFEQVDFIRY